MIDTTIVRAHPCAVVIKKATQNQQKEHSIMRRLKISQTTFDYNPINNPFEGKLLPMSQV